MTTLFTIGYEGAAVGDFVSTLELAGVKHVLDVRQLPQSRRPGFSKTSLAANLETAGIGYTHCRQLGDPKPGRDAARRGEMDLFRAIFEEHLAVPATQAALALAAEAAMRHPVALVCFERDPHGCHRSLVAKRLSEICSLSVRHLGVVEDAAQRRRSLAKAA